MTDGITRFTSLKNPQGTFAEEDMATFFNSPLPAAPKQTLPMFSFATFDDNYRDRAHLRSIDTLGVDVDVDVVTAEQIEAELTRLGIGGFFHPSSSSTVAIPKWHLFVPCDRSMTFDEYAENHKRLREQFRFKVGTQAVDATRAWYCPTQTAANDYQLHVVDGAQWHVRDVRTSLASTPVASATDPTDEQYAALLAEAVRCWPAVGEREEAHMRMSGYLARKGWDRETIARFGRELSAATGNDRPKNEQRARLYEKTFDRWRAGEHDRVPGFDKLQLSCPGLDPQKILNGTFDLPCDVVASSADGLLDGAALATPLGPLTYLIERLGMTAGSGAPHMIAGYGFSAKSLACQAMAIAMAAGKPIWGAYATNQLRVIHVDLEQGRRLTQRRYQRLARAMDVDLRAIGDRLVVAPRPNLQLIEAHRSKWIDLMRGRDVLILDSWRAACAGVDENSSAVRQSLDFLGGLSEETGCRVIFIHHARKPNESNGKSAAKYSIRGSGGFFDGVDCAYIFSADEGYINVSCEKAREHGELAENIALQVADKPYPDDLRGGLSVRMVGTTTVAEDKRRAQEAKDADEQSLLITRVVDEVTNAFSVGLALKTMDDIRDKVRGDKTKVAKAIREAQRRKLIHKTKLQGGEFQPGRDPQDWPNEREGVT